MNEHLQKAQEARKKKRQWALDNLQLDYPDDMQVWEELARQFSFRLPQKHIPNSETKYLKRFFAHMNIDIQDYLECCGVKTVKHLVSLNPTFTARAEIGFALEYVNEINK